MTQEHPITPPPELVREWATINGTSYEDLSALCQNIATQAARWGADQELEACCEYLTRCAAWEPWEPEDIQEMRDLRRPEPPSLKKEAIDTLHLIRDHLPADMYEKSFLIRRALESLPD
jgi:hypothetical protein